MSGRTIAAILVALAVAFVAVVLVASLGDGGDADSAAGTSADTTEPSPDDPTTTTDADPDEPDAPCGVTLAEVQALLPPDSGVTRTPPRTQAAAISPVDGGPRGVDVAIVPGGRAAFAVPAAYEPLDGYGDEAFEASGGGRASAVAFVGDDLYAADVIADGTSATDDDPRALCVRLLELALD